MSAGERQEREDLQLQIAVLEDKRPAPYPTARTITEDGRQALPSYFLHRGNPDSKGSRMERRRADRPPRTGSSASRRRPESAADKLGAASISRDWIASGDNPLTARVMVNRIWQHHFGEGIVRSPSNFGKTGVAPSHPELLDWLAVEFVESGWSIKHMHRLMLKSEAYRMADRDIPANLEKDRENRFFWRQARNRLEAEAIRDQILAVAGTLDRKRGADPPCARTSIRSCFNRARTALGRARPSATRKPGGAASMCSPNARSAIRCSRRSISPTWSPRAAAGRARPSPRRRY